MGVTWVSFANVSKVRGALEIVLKINQLFNVYIAHSVVYGYIAMGALFARRMSPRSGLVSNAGGLEGCRTLTQAPIIQVHNCILGWQGVDICILLGPCVCKLILAETIASISLSTRPDVMLCYDLLVWPLRHWSSSFIPLSFFKKWLTYFE